MASGWPAAKGRTANPLAQRASRTAAKGHTTHGAGRVAPHEWSSSREEEQRKTTGCMYTAFFAWSSSREEDQRKTTHAADQEDPTGGGGGCGGCGGTGGCGTHRRHGGAPHGHRHIPNTPWAPSNWPRGRCTGGRGAQGGGGSGPRGEEAEDWQGDGRRGLQLAGGGGPCWAHFRQRREGGGGGRDCG